MNEESGNANVADPVFVEDLFLTDVFLIKGRLANKTKRLSNVLEDNVVLYRVHNGKRQSLPLVGREVGYGLDIEVAADRWHTLRVEFDGARFKVIFNRQPLFEVEDQARYCLVDLLTFSAEPNIDRTIFISAPA